MALDDVEAQIKKRISASGGISAKVKFDFGDDGVIFVDSTQNPPLINHENAEADTTLICTLDTFQAILEGRQDPNIAYMMGKLKIKGSLGLAMKLNAALEE